MRFCLCILLLILNVRSGLAQENGARVAEAEIVAQQYMTAFYHSDLRTAASLTHPETLRQIRSGFGQERAAAVAAGKEAEFLAQYNLPASANLDALRPTEFYETLLSGYRRSMPDFTTAMKAAQVSVKGSKCIDSEHAVVTLTLTTPAGVGTHTEDAGLSLALVDGQWKVVGNAK